MEVDPFTTCASPFSLGLRAWWPGDGDGRAIIGGPDATLTDVSATAVGRVRQGFQTVGPNPSIVLANIESDPFSFELWVRPSMFASGRALLSKGSGGDFSYRAWLEPDSADPSRGRIGFQLGLARDSECQRLILDEWVPYRTEHSESVTEMRSNDSLAPNSWAHVVFTANSAGQMRIYVNGNPSSRAVDLPAGGQRPAYCTGSTYSWSTEVNIRHSQSAIAFGPSWPGLQNYQGFSDELTVYASELSPAQVQALYGALYEGKCKPDSGPVYPIPPEFVQVRQLLQQRQQIDLGHAVSEDRSGPNLSHIQYFKPNWWRCSGSVNENPAVNSIEMHADGTIYVAYTNPCGPTWYDTSLANHSEDPSGNPPRERCIQAGASGCERFSILKDMNVRDYERWWGGPSQTHRNGQLPAPRWFQVHLSDVQRGRIRFSTAPLLPDAGAFCFHSCFSGEGCSLLEVFGGPGEWQPILPLNYFRDGWLLNNGQKEGLCAEHCSDYRCINEPCTNAWNILRDLAEANRDGAQTALRWNGHPDADDIGDQDRRIPWIESTVEGLVTQSFLSGEDATLDHREAPNWIFGLFFPDLYWLGTTLPVDRGGCGGGGILRAVNALCNDYIVYVRPDPEDLFMLAPDHRETACTAIAQRSCVMGCTPQVFEARRAQYIAERHFALGNENAEHLGKHIETELEQWLVPVGYRPDPGDRIAMTGRWSVDCGHGDWHAELHPYAAFASTHLQPSGRPEAVDNIESVANVVVTGAWSGGTLEYDLWPPARPTPNAVLNWVRDPGSLGRDQGLQPLTITALPPARPNHLHVTIRSIDPHQALRTDRWGQVFYETNRRLATKFHLWWSNPPPPTFSGRNLEVFPRVGNQLMFAWRTDYPPHAWSDPVSFLLGVGGTPAVIQSRFGTRGDFELVVPLATGGLVNYSRRNDLPGLPWVGPVAFGTGVGIVDSVTLIQSNFSAAGSGPGNLEVIARVADQLLFFWRDDLAPFQWRGPIPFISGASGNPVLIQSRFGSQGNFEMIVPLASGGMAHYTRQNDVPGLPWAGPVVFGTTLGRVEALTFIQSSFSASGGGPGNLELLARVGNQLWFMWRDDYAPYPWNGPLPFISGVTGNPVLIQGRFGSTGDFELIVPLASGGMAHYSRQNDVPGLPWAGPTVFGASLGQVDALAFIQSNFGS